MKLLRYGPIGKEKPGMLDARGRIRDLSALVPDISASTLRAGLLERLASVSPDTLPLVAEAVRIGPCIDRVGKFIAVGINYADHAVEANAKIPSEPILFNKLPSCVVGPNDDVLLPPGSARTDWEVELAFIVGKRASFVSEDDAISHVAGYCICNDLSEREYQMEWGSEWTKGKCYPTFGPIGPYLVTPNDVPDPQNLSLWLEVNGERMQNASTRMMIFSIACLVSYISRFVILEPGDLVTTGTPAGVGLGMRPERYLKSGDVMRLGIAGLGEQRQAVK